MASIIRPTQIVNSNAALPTLPQFLPNPSSQLIGQALDNIPMPPQYPPPALVPVPAPTIPSYRQITFYDGATLLVKEQWYEKYAKLQSPVIFRDSNIFRNLIYPTLNDESIKMARTGDDCHTLKMFLDELAYYEISISHQKMQEISEMCGFVDTLMKMKSFVEKKKVATFRKIWAKYMTNVIANHPDDDMQLFTAHNLSHMIRSVEYGTLILINSKRNNIIYDFCSWLEKVVLKGNANMFEKYVESCLSTSNVTPAKYLEQQLEGMKLGRNQKDSVSAILQSCSILNTVLGKSKNSE